MSRIGRQPVPLPDGVTATLADSNVQIVGPRGELSRTIPEGITVSEEDGSLVVKRSGDEPQVRALHGLTRSLLNNMVTGVAGGFTKVLVISGVGYRSALQGRNLRLVVGYSHPVDIEAPAGITFTVPVPTRIEVSGIDKELVGEISAEIRAVRPPEPYLGKGIRYENELIRRKAGKAGKVGSK